MFASMTTIRGWRISIKSTIELVDELFVHNYRYVLTEKFNQHHIEVFWIVLFTERYC